MKKKEIIKDIDRRLWEIQFSRGFDPEKGWSQVEGGGSIELILDYGAWAALTKLLNDIEDA